MKRLGSIVKETNFLGDFFLCHPLRIVSNGNEFVPGVRGRVHLVFFPPKLGMHFTCWRQMPSCWLDVLLLTAVVVR